MAVGFFRGLGNFDPLSASVSLIGWYDFSDNSMLTLSGTSITTVNDKSGNGNHATQSTGSFKPTITTVNGKQCADFDGVDDYLQKLSPTGITNLSSFSLYVVARPESQNSSHIVGIGEANTPDISWILSMENIAFAPPSLMFNIASVKDFSSANPTIEVSLNEVDIYISKFHSGDVSLSENGGNSQSYLDIDSPTSIIASSLQFLIGNGLFNGVVQFLPFDGQIMEIIAFSGQLTSAEETKLLSQLSHKWL